MSLVAGDEQEIVIATVTESLLADTIAVEERKVKGKKNKIRLTKYKIQNKIKKEGRRHCHFWLGYFQLKLGKGTTIAVIKSLLGINTGAVAEEEERQ